MRRGESVWGTLYAKTIEKKDYLESADELLSLMDNLSFLFCVVWKLKIMLKMVDFLAWFLYS